jgi:hypothetical protein
MNISKIFLKYYFIYSSTHSCLPLFSPHILFLLIEYPLQTFQQGQREERWEDGVASSYRWMEVGGNKLEISNSLPVSLLSLPLPSSKE